MSRVKKIASFIASAALAVVTAASLSACGEPVAATWAHGKIMEADITTAATNAMNSNAIDSTTGAVDADKWSKYIADREYDTDSTSTSTDSSTNTDSGSADASADDNADASAQGEGTVAEYREYLIKQKLREDVIDHEIETRNIEISDDAITSAVDSQAKIYEQYYAGGMSGTFESILNRYMGMTMDEFRDTVKESLAQDELKNQVASEAGVSDDSADTDADSSSDSKNTKKSSKKSTKASDTSTDTSADDAKQKAFDDYIDGLVDQADLKVNDCPSDLSYDPATVASQSASSDDSTASNSSDNADSSSDSSSSSDTGTSTDADTTKQE